MESAATPVPKVSVVVEWDTVLEGKPSRGVACLGALRGQVAEMPTCETVVCFDAAETTESAVREAIGTEWPGPLAVVAVAHGVDYYGKKNFGFSLTDGEIVVFLDSDVVPEPDWLRTLTASFDDHRASCVIGRTHLETSSWYERAVALFWIFDARDSTSALRPTARLLSNNVAFRRSLFAHLQFPERPTFRGQCSELAATLQTRLIPMHEQPGARGSHPAPDGAGRFIRRALHAGADVAFYDRLAGTASLSKALANWREDLGHVSERIAERGPVIGARGADRFAAHVLGIVYYSTKAVGYAVDNARR